jgi:hypothetical protein
VGWRLRSRVGLWVALVIGILVVVAFMIISLGFEVLAGRRCRRSINEWARRNQLQLRVVNRKWIALGPWQWKGGRSHRVFSVSVESSDGAVREGFLRIGGGLGGFVADDIEVRWN